MKLESLTHKVLLNWVSLSQTKYAFTICLKKQVSMISKDVKVPFSRNHLINPLIYPVLYQSTNAAFYITFDNISTFFDSIQTWLTTFKPQMSFSTLPLVIFTNNFVTKYNTFINLNF